MGIGEGIISLEHWKAKVGHSLSTTGVYGTPSGVQGLPVGSRGPQWGPGAPSGVQGPQWGPGAPSGVQRQWAMGVFWGGPAKRRYVSRFLSLFVLLSRESLDFSPINRVPILQDNGHNQVELVPVSRHVINSLRDEKDIDNAVEKEEESGKLEEEGGYVNMLWRKRGVVCPLI